MAYIDLKSGARRHRGDSGGKRLHQRARPYCRLSGPPPTRATRTHSGRADTTASGTHRAGPNRSEARPLAGSNRLAPGTGRRKVPLSIGRGESAHFRPTCGSKRIPTTSCPHNPRRGLSWSRGLDP
jgi:hypothetical protein